MASRISQNFEQIKNIDLFFDLKECELKEMLKNGQIFNCKKSESLFDLEEKISNFYIILSGSVALFASDEFGEESILQIIGANKFIGDITSSTFQISAKAIADCIILSIPIQEIKNHAKNNLNFANNLLLQTAQNNSDLLNQLTQLRLANSKQKVGQFLLGMAFEKSGTKDKNIELQYDKSVLASYLGINPETLSRTLQKLKNDGEILVEKNQITLTQEHSLCNYCSSKIAKKCNHLKTNFCTQT